MRGHPRLNDRKHGYATAPRVQRSPAASTQESRRLASNFEPEGSPTRSFRQMTYRHSLIMHDQFGSNGRSPAEAKKYRLWRSSNLSREVFSNTSTLLKSV